MATYPWVVATTSSYMGLSLEKFPHVQRWIATIESRPAVQIGMKILTPEFNSKYGTLAS